MPLIDLVSPFESLWAPLDRFGDTFELLWAPGSENEDFPCEKVFLFWDTFLHNCCQKVYALGMFMCTSLLPRF